MANIPEDRVTAEVPGHLGARHDVNGKRDRVRLADEQLAPVLFPQFRFVSLLDGINGLPDAAHLFGRECPLEDKITGLVVLARLRRAQCPKRARDRLPLKMPVQFMALHQAIPGSRAQMSDRDSLCI